MGAKRPVARSSSAATSSDQHTVQTANSFYTKSGASPPDEQQDLFTDVGSTTDGHRVVMRADEEKRLREQWYADHRARCACSGFPVIDEDAITSLPGWPRYLNSPPRALEKPDR